MPLWGGGGLKAVISLISKLVSLGGGGRLFVAEGFLYGFGTNINYNNVCESNQWHSRKSVKGGGGAEGTKNFFGTFLHLTPLKTYFLIKFGPF